MLNRPKGLHPFFIGRHCYLWCFLWSSLNIITELKSDKLHQLTIRTVVASSVWHQEQIRRVFLANGPKTSWCLQSDKEQGSTQNTFELRKVRNKDRKYLTHYSYLKGILASTGGRSLHKKSFILCLSLSFAFSRCEVRCLPLWFGNQRQRRFDVKNDVPEYILFDIST